MLPVVYGDLGDCMHPALSLSAPRGKEHTASPYCHLRPNNSKHDMNPSGI
jgi:hypothetical protein